MSILSTKVAECECKDYARLLTEQFIGGLSGEGMIDQHDSVGVSLCLDP